MAAPVLAKAGLAVASSRRGRRALVGALLAVLIASLFGMATIVAVAASVVAHQSTAEGGYGPSQLAVADIPPDYLRLYVTAAGAYGLDWSILAAIGKIESDHGRGGGAGIRSGVNFAGCCAGPMQFYIVGPSSTWDAYGVDGDRDGDRDVYDPTDAIPAAANYLVASGAPGDYRRAIFAYNHADWYVDDVMAQAARYRGALRDAQAGGGGGLQAGGASVEQLLRSNRVTLSGQMVADLRAGKVDPRVVATLIAAASRHEIVVTSLVRPGSVTASGGTSNHSFGRAADIGSVDGEACTGSRDGRCGTLARELSQIEGPLRSTELIYAFDPDGSGDPRGFADPASHSDHVHVGFDG